MRILALLGLLTLLFWSARPGGGACAGVPAEGAAVGVLPRSGPLRPAQGDPPLVPAYQGDRLLGYVYLNSDFTNAVGYSGKPIHILVGIDPQGVIRGIKLVDHKEPIVLVGIPERRIVDAMNALDRQGHEVRSRPGPSARPRSTSSAARP